MDISLALPLMTAIHPMLLHNSSFQEHVILVLRKSIFGSELQSRLAAVTGFLYILQHLPQDTEKQEELGHEILGKQTPLPRLISTGFLRRCFTQQYEIRKELYHSLTKVYEMNSNLGGVIIELLLPQLQKYTVEDEDEPPITLSLCIDGKPADDGPSKPMSAVKFLEPFPALIAALSRILILHTKAKKGEQKEKDVSDEDGEQVFRRPLIFRTRRVYGSEKLYAQLYRKNGESGTRRV